MSEAKTQDRHLMALPVDSLRILLSWRLLRDDRPDVGFFVHWRPRASAPWRRLHTKPITDSTCYLHELNKLDLTRLDLCGVQSGQFCVVTDDWQYSEPAAFDWRFWKDRPFCAVRSSWVFGERIGDIALGDLENNGRIGFVVAVAPFVTQTIQIVAISHDADESQVEPLWRFDTRLPAVGGWNGSMKHVPFLAWDVNGDGRTEVLVHACRSEYAAARYENAGPDDTLVCLDAQTGGKVWEVPWPGTCSRVMMTVGHLRGLDRPASIVVQDETYGPVTLTAIDGRDGGVQWRVTQQRPGGHNLDVADIDEDGVQEVLCGGVCYNGDGTVRWHAEPFGHSDISKPAKIDPSRAGLQIWYAVESDNPGVYLVDKDGRTIFKEPFRHAHYGWVARHTAAAGGLQPHTAEDARLESKSRGETRLIEHNPIFLPDGSHWLNLTEWQRKNFVPVHWDAGPEVVFAVRKEHKRIVRLLPDGEIEDLPGGALPADARIGRNLACADILGDYRENIVTVEKLNEFESRLLVLANPTPCDRRGYSPWEDFAYRHDRSQHASGYYIYLSPPDTTISAQ
jgi:hypothetical protein